MIHRILGAVEQRGTFLLLLAALASAIGGAVAYRELAHHLHAIRPSVAAEQKLLARMIEIDGKIEEVL